MTVQPMVHVVDDDAAIRDALVLLLEAAGHSACAHADAQQFLAALGPAQPGCVVADVRMPGMSGLELLQWMGQQQLPLPVIVITGHGEVPVAVTAFRGGAWDFLEKPFAEEYFLERVRAALAHDVQTRQRAGEQADVFARYSRLSRRERAVMDLLVRGLANKLVAAELDIGIRTVESHRSNVLKKMGASSLSELTRQHLRLHGKDA